MLLTAWIAGTGPAVLAIALGTFSAAHFFIAPAHSLYIESLPELIQLMIYVTVNCVATLLFNRLERQRQLAENRSAENERLSQSLREADERKDEFLALLAHELRNPLAPIRSSLALLDRKGESGEVVSKTKEVIRRQTNHLVRITDDLLFDLIILDIGLPGMDGYEIARRIRRLELSPQPRLIALTGWGGASNRELATQAGFDVHLVKPINFQVLLEQVSITVERQSARPTPAPARNFERLVASH